MVYNIRVLSKISTVFNKTPLLYIAGEDGYQEWRGDPSNPSLALKWQRIHGTQCDLHFVADEAGFLVQVFNFLMCTTEHIGCFTLDNKTVFISRLLGL